MELIQVLTTKNAPHHKANELINIQPYLAEKMISRGWAVNPNEVKKTITNEDEKPSKKTSKKDK